MPASAALIPTGALAPRLFHPIATAFMACLLACTAAAPARAAPARTLSGELTFLLDQINDALEKDGKLAGRTVSLGRISSENNRETHYGPELRRLFEARLGGRLVPKGHLTLSVDYDLIASSTDILDGTKLHILQLHATIKDDQRKPLWEKHVEINDSVDIARVMGLTVAPPPNGSQAQRHKAVEEAAMKNVGKPAAEILPNFTVTDGSRIGIPGCDRFAVEIWVKGMPDGEACPVVPVHDSMGNAFIDIKPDQFYEIVIYNHDQDDCIAQIRIDGQDAINRFNADGVHYPGLLVFAGKSGRLRGWLHTVKPRTKENDNVFAFAVKEYGHGSAAPVPFDSTAEIGMITVQFAPALKPGEGGRGGRDMSRFTDKGPGIAQKLTLEKRDIGDFNETITVRYSPTAR